MFLKGGCQANVCTLGATVKVLSSLNIGGESLTIPPNTNVSAVVY